MNEEGSNKYKGSATYMGDHLAGWFCFYLLELFGWLAPGFVFGGGGLHRGFSTLGKKLHVFEDS